MTVECPKEATKAKDRTVEYSSENVVVERPNQLCKATTNTPQIYVDLSKDIIHILEKEVACSTRELWDRLTYQQGLKVKCSDVTKAIQYLESKDVIRTASKPCAGMGFKFVYLLKKPYYIVERTIKRKISSHSSVNLPNEVGEEGERVIRETISALGLFCFDKVKKSDKGEGLNHKGIDVYARAPSGFFYGIESKNRKRFVDRDVLLHHIDLCREASEKWNEDIKPVLICTFINNRTFKEAQAKKVIVIYTERVFYPSSLHSLFESHKRLTGSDYYVIFDQQEKERLMEKFRMHLLR